MGTFLTKLLQYLKSIFQRFHYNALLHQHRENHINILREIEIEELYSLIGCKLDKGQMFSVSK